MFTDILNTYINGNISDAVDRVDSLSTKDMANFILYGINGVYKDEFTKLMRTISNSSRIK